MKKYVNARVGDFLRCDRLYPQSKKYTVGELYEIIAIENIASPCPWREEPHLVIRDDNKKLTRINQRYGISFTDLTLVKFN